MGKVIRKRIIDFGGGKVNDIRENVQGGFSIAKHFDILTYPKKLKPLRGMTTESTTNSKIGNIIVSSNSRMYGVGTDPNNPNNGKLWVRSDNNTTASGSSYGASSTWRSLTTDQLSGAVLRSGDEQFLVEYVDAGNVRTMFWASTNLLIASDPLGASAASTQALTFSTISQGFVHPKDKILYFGYQTSSATYIGLINANATPFATVNFTALQLPSQYRVYSITNWGNYLAIACTSTFSSAGLNTSVVFLWDRDTSNTTVNEVINWGAGSLKVLNNLNGTLIGVNTLSAASTGSVQDYDSVQIKGWSGGDSATLIDEVSANNAVAAGVPSCTINPNVNFIYQNRLYYSVNITINNSTTGLYGLWVVGKNKQGQYVTNIERMATNGGTETGVLAAAISGDFVAMAHTAIGTLTASTNGQTSSSTFAASSVYESLIEDLKDEELGNGITKKLIGVTVMFEPIPTGGSVVLKYKRDAETSWTTIFTYTTANGMRHDAINIESTGANLGTYKEVQFQITATGGATPNGLHFDNEVISDGLY